MRWAITVIKTFIIDTIRGGTPWSKTCLEIELTCTPTIVEMFQEVNLIGNVTDIYNQAVVFKQQRSFSTLHSLV